MISLKTEFKQNFYFYEKAMFWVAVPLLILLSIMLTYPDWFIDPILNEYLLYTVQSSKGFDYSLIPIIAVVGVILFLKFSIVILSFVTAFTKKYNIKPYQKIYQFIISLNTAFLLSKKYPSDGVSHIEKIKRILSESIENEKENKELKRKYSKLEMENKELKDQLSNKDNSDD